MFKYFLEIKNRFLLLLLSWGATIFISYTYKKPLLFLLIKPNIDLLNPFSIYFIYTNITDIFSTYMQLIVFLGNQIFIIYLVYHILIFLSPGLYNLEYKYLKLILFAGFIFWCCSIIILNKLLLPLCWQFFISFQESINDQTIKFYFEAKINEYLNFYILLYYICNLNCQGFTGLFFFLDYINADLKVIRRIRKVVYFFFFF
jgi:sec-independent protein translocase protein TatC